MKVPPFSMDFIRNDDIRDEPNHLEVFAIVWSGLVWSTLLWAGSMLIVQF